MSPALSVAASLSPAIRQAIGIQVIAGTEPVSHLAATHQVSRKFVYQQGNRAQRSLDESFAPSQGDDEVLFHLSVTKSWLYQLILGLALICHSSYRGVVELLRDLFDTSISIGTVHNRLPSAAVTAEISQAQDLSGRGSSEGNTFDWELNPQSPAKWTSEGSIPDSECYLGGTWIEPHR